MVPANYQNQSTMLLFRFYVKSIFNCATCKALLKVTYHVNTVHCKAKNSKKVNKEILIKK